MCTVIESEPVIGCGIWHVCKAIDDDDRYASFLLQSTSAGPRAKK